MRFQISRVDDDSEKFGVQAYVLNSICKGLHLHPILPSLTWDHISDLKLADPEFKTPSRVDILLGAEVFMDILRDGRRKGPPGTPSALNTMLGWVVFGKIEGGDVEEVANLTLERMVDRTDVDTRRCFVSVATPNKSRYFRRRKRRRVVQRQPHTCYYDDHRTYYKGFDRYGASQVARREMAGVSVCRKMLGNQGVSAGGMLAPGGTRSGFPRYV